MEDTFMIIQVFLEILNITQASSMREQMTINDNLG